MIGSYVNNSLLAGRSTPVSVTLEGDRIVAVDDIGLDGGVLDPHQHVARLEKLIARIEEINAEIAERNAAKRLLFRAAKDVGYDLAAIRATIKRRCDAASGKDPVQHDAILTVYLSALGEPLSLPPGEAVTVAAARTIARESRALATLRARNRRHFMIEG